jgi:MEMO1 family protein
MTVDEALRSGQLALLEAAIRRVSYESTLGGAQHAQAQQILRDLDLNLRAALRKSALSALFFEADSKQLAASIDRNLAAPQSQDAVPKIIIAPHAGHIYSGGTAGKAYAKLAAHAANIRRVVLLGPAHRVYFQGIALPGAGSFETPLGCMPLDTLGMAAVADLPFVCTRADAHAQEHSLEVHVPFLQRALPQATLVPLLVGDVAAQSVAQLMDRLWADADTVFVISTDLSHFHTYEQAKALDAVTCEQILALDAGLTHEQACGATPVNGALTLAKARGMRIAQIERLNSGDTAGNSPQGRERVVGYASFALYESDPSARIAIDSIANNPDLARAAGSKGLKNAALQTLTAEQGQQLIFLARHSLAQQLQGAPMPAIDTQSLQAFGASFVTLTMHGQLRGCIGSLQAHRPLAQDVQANALAAALHDPRFPPVTAQDLPQLKLEVSVLSAPEPLLHANESHALWQLRPGIDGLIFETTHQGQHYRSTYLPQVWEQIPEPRAFLAHLKVKAGLPFDFWSPQVKLWRYSVQKFHEQ